MAELKFYTVKFNRTELVDGILTVTHPAGVAVDTAYYAVIRYAKGGLPTFPTGLLASSTVNCTVNVGEITDGDNLISIYYK